MCVIPSVRVRFTVRFVKWPPPGELLELQVAPKPTAWMKRTFPQTTALKYPDSYGGSWNWLGVQSGGGVHDALQPRKAKNSRSQNSGHTGGTSWRGAAAWSTGVLKKTALQVLRNKATPQLACE